MKKENTIGCCGIDCGFVTCCVVKRGMETCADCSEFPCSRFENEKSGFDSFVTHKKVFPNLEYIKLNGTDLFVSQQRIRIEILTDLLKQCDDGRSKSSFCLSCALLPMDKLRDCHRYLDMIDVAIDIKGKSKLLKERIQLIAKDLQIDLKLNNKK